MSTHNTLEKVIELARAARLAGGRALLVGGCVRDPLMGREPKDWDVEIYGLEPARLRQLLDRFGNVNAVGEAFTVYKIGQHLDVSLPRRERKQGRGHRAFIVEGDPAMTVEEAARRRDFTINAILQDPLTLELIDPYGGREDITRRTLRAVSAETFPEDSLRVLRAAQFAARFEFDIEPRTIELCREIDLTDLPRERIWGEMEKLLLHARRPSIGFQWLVRLGAIDQLFPELKALIGVPQDAEWHPEGWSISEMPFKPLAASVTQSKGIDGRPTLREFITSASTNSTVIPTSDSTVDTQSAEATTTAPFIATNSTGTDDFHATTMARPAILAPAESLVWSFGAPTSAAHEIIGVVFKIPFNCVCSIVRGAINDFEIIRGIVHPVAIFVMNVFPSFKTTTELQLHNDAMNPDSTVSSFSTGIHITFVVVDARTTSIDGDVLFYFDLAVKRDNEFFHSSEVESQRYFEATLGDVFYHTTLVIDRARELIDDLPYAKQVTVMLAALCHDLGKPATTAFIDGRWRSRGHDTAGLGPTESLLDRLNIHTLDGYDVRAQTLALVHYHLKPGEFYNQREEIGDGAFRRLARKCELELLYRVARADTLGRNADWVPREKWYDAVPQEWFIARARELAVEEKAPKHILMGRHLLDMGVKPSPRMGQIVDAVYEMQLDGRVRTLEEAREAARKLIADERL